jgi:HSP20 family protein
MLVRWSDFDRSLAMMDLFRRGFDRFWSENEDAFTQNTRGHGSRAVLWDDGSNLVLLAEVPGLTEAELKLTVHQDVLSLEGERKVKAPEGYATHRQERGEIHLSRSFTFPCRIDAERTVATLKDGVLTVTLPKVAEDRPRQIAVKSARTAPELKQ